MLKILSDADRKKKARGGRRNKLNLKDQLLVTLEYIREYRTYFHIGKSYDISESTVYKTVRWVEDTLIKHPTFALPGRKELINNNYDTILIDATETPIERPKKSKRSSTPEKRRDIKGRKHDFKLFKESKYHIHKDTQILTDTGYQGIKKLHVRAELPKKKSKTPS